MTFTYTVLPADWGRIAPELVLVGMTLLLMLVDLLLPHAGGKRTKHSGPENFLVLPVLAFLGVVGALAATIILFLVGDQQRAFNNMVGSDWGTLYAYLIILSASGLGLLFSPAYLKRLNLVHQGEYYALFTLATVGMMLLAAATSFLLVFLGIEMLSLALYILCGFVARRKSSQEAGMKYFLLSSFASAFLLYGIALVYGSTGSTSFSGVASFLQHYVTTALPQNASYVGHLPFLLVIAMGLLAVGFAFKVSAIPFQAWTPDVYQGAPGPVTAFMSVGTKAAALVAFARVFAMALGPVRAEWEPVIWALAILTIVGGNVLALVQSNVKRLLAYSGIAHAGYLLIGIVVAGSANPANAMLGIGAILFYLLCYAFINVGAFGAVSMLERVDNSGLDARDLRGLWYRQPVLAGFLAFFLLALAGFPPMAGFAAKYSLFYAAIAGGYPELLLIGVLASVLGMYYYLRIIATMFMEREETPSIELPVVPAAPTQVPVTPRRLMPRSGSLRSGGGTALATRTPTRTLTIPKTPVVLSTEEGQKDTSSQLSWVSWLAIGLCALGALAMGTILPFWLFDLAQQGASMLLK